MPRYVAADHARPWIILFESARLSEMAEAIGAQPAPAAIEVRVVGDAGTRNLTKDEAEELRVLCASVFGS